MPRSHCQESGYDPLRCGNSWVFLGICGDDHSGLGSILEYSWEVAVVWQWSWGAHDWPRMFWNVQNILGQSWPLPRTEEIAAFPHSNCRAIWCHRKSSRGGWSGHGSIPEPSAAIAAIQQRSGGSFCLVHTVSDAPRTLTTDNNNLHEGSHVASS